jgi:hypothetical protein
MLKIIYAIWKILRHVPAALTILSSIIDYIGSDAVQKILSDFLALLSNSAEKSVDGTPIPPSADTARRRLRDLVLRRFAATVYQIPESALDACVALYKQQRQEDVELAKRVSLQDYNAIT